MAVLHSILVAAIAGTVLAAPQPRADKFTTIPLRQRQVAQVNGHAQTLHAASKHTARSSKFAIAPENLDAGFWYGTFTIGKTTNLSLLIDTGSNDVALNPNLYKPTPQSQNLHTTGELRYATAQANGCGFADISYNTFTDLVSFEGLTATNQTFANVKKTPPPNPETITVFPHQGLVGFGIGADQTQLDGPPFFKQLCDQKAVDQCRFGIAYGTAGRESTF